MRSSDLFERITRQIAEAIEAGAGEFRMPWHRWGEALTTPINAASDRPYRGINILVLWASAEASGYSTGRWATYRQWAAAGAQVRKGEKGTPVVFWKPSVDVGDQANEVGDTARPRFVARLYAVFNADQVDGAPAPNRNSIGESDRVHAAERFFEATRADVRHGGDRACYVSSLDQIWLPKFEQFRDAPSYYSTLAHETIHWSGAKHRLDRDLSGRFGTQAYAMEELVAELGSAFIAAHLGLSVEPRPDHAAYIRSWLQVLRTDPRAILTAAAKAQEASDFVAGFSSVDGVQCYSTKEPELEQLAA